MCCLFFFFKQKTAYEMRISDWSSDVCSSDLYITPDAIGATLDAAMQQTAAGDAATIPLVSSNSPALFSYFEDGEDGVGAFALPATDDPEETFVPLSPELLAVSATAKNPEGAKAFLEYLSDPERAAEYADPTQTLPILAGVEALPSTVGRPDESRGGKGCV